MNRLELTVIIPTLNEEKTLRETLENLACQQKVSMEIIVADGGSTDATRQIVMSAGQTVTFAECEDGRSRQLNAGARLARGEFLLFLHADSRFGNTLALRKGIDELRRAAGPAPLPPLAGRFSLTFDRSSVDRSLGYRFFELKARLDRPGCSHGDQGFLMPRALFTLEGPFSETCELLAQTRFADEMRKKGQWILLSPEIITSARRFEAEGLRERQTINALIMACGAAGMEELLAEIPTLYREQSACGRLATAPILRRFQLLIDGLPPKERHAFWGDIGNYVLENAWQAAFFLDVLRGQERLGNGRGDRTLFLRLFDRHIFRWLDNRVGKLLALMLVRSWLRLKAMPPLPRTG